MATSTNDVAKSPPRRRFFRTFKGVVAAGSAALLIAFLALLWPGWPLHPLASLASGRARSQGLELQVRSPWLHLRTDLTLWVEAATIRVGDTTNPEALALDKLVATWRLRELLNAHWAPASVQLDEAACTLVTDAFGSLHFVSLPVAPPDAAASPFTPADLPADFL
ncbi:MAG TPA: hypothetical protein VK968_18415, partial [Roseimicrobium sp.]|nr:hypothetical protein [Roseimicrobium sp.]